MSLFLVTTRLQTIQHRDSHSGRYERINLYRRPAYSALNKQHVLVKTSRLDEIADHAGMPNKGWVFSGDESPEFNIGEESENGTTTRSELDS